MIKGKQMNVTVNGKKVSTCALTAFSIRDEMNQNAEVVILNGFKLSSDHPLSDGDALTLIEKGVMPDKGQLEGMMASRHTPYVHEKLKKGRVAVAGLGGLGSNIALMLARIGVGELLLVDFDIVEPSNLNRQCYDMRHLGKFKTDAICEQISLVNPFIKVKTACMRVKEENAAELFQGYDVVCEAFDDPIAKAALVNALLSSLPDVTVVAASGMAGYGSSNLIKTKKMMKNLYVCGDETSEAAPGNGLMAPRVALCAAHQANMVLRLLVGEEGV